MIADDSWLTAEIRKWLKGEALTNQEHFDLFEVPQELFAVSGAREQELLTDRFIRGLPLADQKLLFYVCREMDPLLIMESMPFESPEQFWIKRGQLVGSLQQFAGRGAASDPDADLRSRVIKVFEIRENLLGEILFVSDELDKEAQRKKRRRRKWQSLTLGFFVLIFAYLVVYPLVVRPNTDSLFDRYKSTVSMDTAIDTTSYDSNRFYESMKQFLSDDYASARPLFEELITEGTDYKVTARWFVALIYLGEGELKMCREQLRLLKDEDPVFFRENGKGLLRKIR